MRRAGPPREIPPPLELECLKVLWKLGEGNVKDVRLALAASRNLAYTTVMTVLDRLVRKGAAARRKAGRAYVYSPVLLQDSVRRLAVRELVDSFFGGSQEALLDYLQGRESEPPEYGPPAENTGLDTTLL